MNAPERQIAAQLAFTRKLQVLTTRIHATQKISEIMVDLAADICEVFNADRLTLYAVQTDGKTIVSKVKTGLGSFSDIKLPIEVNSIAGFVAKEKNVVNISDVYDDEELRAIHPQLRFLSAVDQKTGYRTRQVLASPIVDTKGGLIGVVQLINRKDGKEEAFGSPEVEGIHDLCQTLAVAMQQRLKGGLAARPTKFDSLVKHAVLSADELALAVSSARRKSEDVEHVLARDFKVPLAKLGAALSDFFGVEYEAFKSDRHKPIDALKLVKREFAEEQGWVPIEEGQGVLTVLAVDPERIRSMRSAENIFPKAKVTFKVTTQHELNLTLDQFYGKTDEPIKEQVVLAEDDDGIDESMSASMDAAQDNELVKFVNQVIVDAYNQGASDIHIEPYPGRAKTEIRFRKDGTLFKYTEVPSSYRDAMVTRLKIMCDLDISEKRKPQDGKIKFKKHGPLDIELRVATIPSQGGVEDVVMRILAGGEPIPLAKLGLTDHNMERLKTVVSKPYGLFFVCGPTGSGKTTTLHSILGYLNTPETKIWTAEDPVEITQKGLRQVQVNKKAGLDFAAVMKSFLRADPDIIMVGEMRDAETTGTGIEASLTGHLVFATLHTNSAPESIIRLLDMGMDPFNFSDALLGVLAQRLAKRLCPDCKEAYNPEADEIKTLLGEYAEELKTSKDWVADPKGQAKALYETWVKQYGVEGKLRLYRPKGCDKCSGTGYRGRVGLHELLVGSDSVKKLIQEKGRVSEIFTVGVAEGMRTLKMDGIEKVLMGSTDVKQVRAVCIK